MPHLELLTVFDATLCSPKCSVLQLTDQFWVEGDLPGGGRVQISNTIHVALGGCHVQRCVIVIVQTPKVGTESYQEGERTEVAVGSCQVEWRVPPDITFVWITSKKQERRCLIKFIELILLLILKVFFSAVHTGRFLVEKARINFNCVYELI